MEQAVEANLADSILVSARQRPTGVGYELLRVLLAAILLIAGGLKGYQLATEPVAGPRPWLILEVEMEWLLAVWLLSGLHKRLCWMATTACFAVFCAITAYKATTGQSSCGCFGKVQVNPWYTLVMDVAALALLLAFRPKHGQRTRLGIRAAVTVIIALAGGIPAAVAMARYHAGRIQDDSQIAGDARHVLLEPDTWLGKPFSLERYINTSHRITSGRWMLLFYHHDCPNCQEAIGELGGTAFATAQREGFRFGLIELPPYGPLKGLPEKPKLTIVGRLPDDRQWLMATPALVWLDQGKVVKAQEDWSSASRHKLSVPAGTGIVCSEETCDLGYVEFGSVYKVTFRLASPTGRDVAVRKAISQCGCAAVADWPKRLAAGQISELVVVFTAPNEMMNYAKDISLICDGPRASTLNRQIKARVGIPLQVQPASLELGSLAPDEVRTAQVSIVNEARQPVRLLYSTSADSSCVALVPTRSVASRTTIAMSIKISAKGKRSGAYSVPIQIHTDLEKMPALEIQIRYHVTDKS